MELEIAWFIGGCLLSWCLGYGAGAFHRSVAQVMESAV